MTSRSGRVGLVCQAADVHFDTKDTKDTKRTKCDQSWAGLKEIRWRVAPFVSFVSFVLKKVVAEGPYRPANSGARFSTKALAAAAWSAVIMVRTMWVASRSSTSERVEWAATLRLRFM